MLNLRGVPTLFFGSRGWEWNLYRVLKEETFISAVAMKYVPVKFNSQQPLPSVKLRGIWLLRKPKLDVKMSFWVVFMLFIKTVPEWNTYLFTDNFFRRAGPKCHRRQTCGDNAGSENSRVTSVDVSWNPMSGWYRVSLKNIQNALQNGAVEAFFWQNIPVWYLKAPNQI